MHIHKKYKTDFKKYCKSDVEKCKSVSIEIKRSDRADLVDMCLDFDIFLEKLNTVHSRLQAQVHVSSQKDYLKVVWKTSCEIII